MHPQPVHPLLVGICILSHKPPTFSKHKFQEIEGRQGIITRQGLYSDHYYVCMLEDSFEPDFVLQSTASIFHWQLYDSFISQRICSLLCFQKLHSSVFALLFSVLHYARRPTVQVLFSIAPTWQKFDTIFARSTVFLELAPHRKCRYNTLCLISHLWKCNWYLILYLSFLISYIGIWCSLASFLWTPGYSQEQDVQLFKSFALSHLPGRNLTRCLQGLR